MSPVPIPVGIDRPDRDLTKGHPLLQARWPDLKNALQTLGMAMIVNEVYRSDERQQWLYAAGRTPGELRLKGIPDSWARPKDLKVTNAWSAATSAHGWREGDKPAAAALDVVPVGGDGKPWTADDPWDEFVAAVAELSVKHGLRHFQTHGKGVTDRPHLQLTEWSDIQRALILRKVP